MKNIYLLSLYALLITTIYVHASDDEDPELNQQLFDAIDVDDPYEDIIDLLNHGAEANTQNSYGTTPLHSAAFHGREDVVRELTKRGANINAKDKDANTPLHDAAYWNHFEIVKFFLESGAHSEEKNRDNKTSADLAELNEHLETAAYIRNYDDIPVTKGAINEDTGK